MARLICTHCTRPTDALYKVYSNPGWIQLTTCDGCGNDVDPYIEREWLLVVLDCVLHRPGAFRHLLYNREPFRDIIMNDAEDTTTTTTTTTMGGGGGATSSKKGRGRDRQLFDASTIGRFARYAIASSFLRAYLRYAAKDGYEGGTNVDDDLRAMDFVASLAYSIAGDAVLVSSTIFAASYYAIVVPGRSHSSDDATGEDPHASERASYENIFYRSRLFLALTTPVLFHVATIFALVWEDSFTVRSSGAMFVLSLQQAAVSVVVEERMNRMKNYNRHDGNDASIDRPRCTCRQGPLLSGYLPHSFPFLVGLIARALFVRKRWWTSIPLDGRDLACTGMALPKSFPFGLDSFCIE
ncbi:hypothetical protein ACHAW5_002820 [Stephanodiscus triporus]|uniref:Protein ARV n=1 Tax=Stephanodiscus triporus TaxID=2934178 RepID=A0ABD3Q575_9STRA